MDPQPPAPAPTPVRVLIVEDDIVDRLACRRVFARAAEASFVLLEADTGADGLALAESERPDCILLDYNLPDLNGLEFLSRLTGGRGHTPMPVMLLTGADSAAVAAAAMKAGADDYLGKDVDGQYLELLPAAILRMLRERQLAEDKRRAQAMFRSLVEQLDAITYTRAPGPSGALQYISPQVALLGYTPEEWMADPGLHARLIHADDRLAAQAAILAGRLSGAPLRVEYRLARRDGEYLWFREQSKTVMDEAGNALFVQGLLVDITQSKNAEEALRRSQEELRQLAAHQERIKEAERKRIAQEIHDELGGLLTGIKAHLSVLLERGSKAGGTPDPLLTDAAALADSGFQSVRRVITDLRPSVLDQLGVWAALEWYAGQMEKRSGLVCTCSIDAELQNIEPDAETSTMLFRIAQEALTNAIRHAQAQHIDVRASWRDGILTLEVEDDGRGIASPNPARRESWGIVGMHERARHFGGTLTIAGRPGHGTVVSLRVPLENTNAQ